MNDSPLTRLSLQPDGFTTQFDELRKSDSVVCNRLQGLRLTSHGDQGMPPAARQRAASLPSVKLWTPSWFFETDEYLEMWS